MKTAAYPRAEAAVIYLVIFVRATNYILGKRVAKRPHFVKRRL